MFAWYHWLAVAAPACAVCALAFSCRRYVRSVSDFLVAGRCAGRYVLLSGSMMGSLSVVTLVAGVETGYTSGWAYSFWNDLLMPLSAMLSLYGWIRWTVSDAEWAVKFPVNSVELSFFAMLVALLLYVAVPVALGLLTSVWFSWGTARDLRRLFRDLETRVRDDRDNGMVEKDAPKAPRPAAGGA